MNKEELKLHVDDFTYNCIFNEYSGVMKLFLDYCEKSKTFNEFLEFVYKDDNLKMSQGYAELSKKYNLLNSEKDHNDRLLEMLKNVNADIFYTDSDMGSVLVGNTNFQVLIDNGLGDGETTVAIVPKGKRINLSMFNYLTVFQGKTINVYAYDCVANNIKRKLSGRYQAFSIDGIVIFLEL